MKIVSPSEEITVLNFLSADANMCLHKVRMRITTVRHIFHHSWRCAYAVKTLTVLFQQKNQLSEFRTTRRPTEISKKMSIITHRRKTGCMKYHKLDQSMLKCRS